MDGMAITATRCLETNLMSEKCYVRTERWKSIIDIIDIAVISLRSHSGT